MTPGCQIRVSLLGRRSAFVAGTIAALSGSDSTAPIVPRKYIVTTSETVATVGDIVIVDAQLVDANDHAVNASGRTVFWVPCNADGHFSFNHSATNQQGIATASYVVGTKTNTSCVISVVDDQQLKGDAPAITVQAGPPTNYAVTPSQLAPSVGATISLAAKLSDQFGNPLSIAGRVVTWSIVDNSGGYYYQRGVRTSRLVPNGLRTNRLAAPTHAQRTGTSGGTFASPTSATNAQGLATVDFNVGTIVNGYYTIFAEDDQGASGTSAPITVHPGPIVTFIVDVSVTDPPAGAAVMLRAHPTDAYNNTVTSVGMPVNWSATGDGGTLSAAMTSLSQHGAASNLLNTGSTPGTSYVVTASGGPQASGTSPTITALEHVSLSSLASTFGAESSCGISTTGRVWCWGTRNGAFPSRPVPGKPIGDQTMSALTNSASHSCGIGGGTVFCWGSDGAGQLGDNSRTDRSTPAPIASTLSFTAVSAGVDHTCKLATSGDIYCWGRSDSGRLGDGTGFTGLGPVKVGGGLTFTAVSAGDAHTCAIAVSGDAYCWG